MPTSDQFQAVHDLIAQGQSDQQISVAVGLEIGDVESLRAHAAFLSESLPPRSELRHIEFSFAHDTPGLTEGVVAYAPKVGEILVAGWLDLITAWDGVTPTGDFGMFAGTNTGLGRNVMGGVSVLSQNSELAGAGARFSLVTSVLLGVVSQPNPIKVVVSRDGTIGGADPGSTQGEATLHLLVL